jgi:hypothetical protein
MRLRGARFVSDLSAQPVVLPAALWILPRCKKRLRLRLQPLRLQSVRTMLSSLWFSLRHLLLLEQPNREAVLATLLATLLVPLLVTLLVTLLVPLLVPLLHLLLHLLGVPAGRIVSL